MAQIIKHRRGSLEALSAVTSSLQKGELVIASGSSNLSVTNGASIVFAVPENGQVQAVNRFLVGANAPNTFAAGTYNGMVKGVPYYASGSSTLYLLGEGANDIPDLTGNISNFSSSVSSSISALSASIGGGSIGNSVTLLSSKTGSYATTGSNVFKGEQIISSSLIVTNAIKGTGSIFLQPDINDVRKLEIYNTAATDVHIKAIGGLTFLGDDTNYVLVNDSAQTITITGSNGVYVGGITETIGAFSQSVNSRLSNLQSTSASVNTSIAELNTFSGSQETKDSTLATYTGSVNTRLTEIGVVSGSLISSASAAAIASTNLNTFSGSVLTRLTEVGVVTGSLISSASNVLTRFNAFSSSFDTAFDISGTNVTIAGNLTVAGTTTQIDSTTVQIGDNIIELNGTGAANGGLLVKDPTAPNTVSGSLLWDSTNDYWKAGAAGAESKLLREGGDNVVTASSQILFTGIQGFTTYDTALSTITGSLISSASAAKTTNDAQDVSITNLNSNSASVNTSVAALNSFTSSNASTTALNTFTGSANTRFTEIGVVSGSLIASASAAKTTNDSQDVSITNLNSATASLIIETTNLELFSGSANTRFTEIGVVSGSLIASASAAKTTNDSQGVSITNLNSTTASLLIETANLETFSSSALTRLSALEVETANLETFSGSVLTRLTEIGVVSGSLITSASNAKTTNDSQDVSITNLNTFTSSFGTTFSSSVDSRLDTLEGTGTIQGVGTSNNVTFAKVTTTGDVVVGGDLVVQGNTVTLNTATLVVEDKLITLASGSTSSATADGAGFEVTGANANFVYQHSTTAFTSSVALIAPAVTASFNLGSAAGSSKRVAFRNTNGNLDLVPTASVSGDLLQWDGTNFVMSNIVDGGSF